MPSIPTFPQTHPTQTAVPAATAAAGPAVLVADAGGKVMKQLYFGGGPSDEGAQLKMRVITQCFQFKGTLFGEGKHTEVYKMMITTSTCLSSLQGF